MSLEEIIYLEKLHRWVFDNLYVQNYKIDESDQPVLNEYKELCKKYPNWRSILQKEFGEYYKKYKRYFR